MTTRLVPLEIYAETLKRLESTAKARGSDMWCTCGKEYDGSELDELEMILRGAADQVREVLIRKVSELPEGESDAETLAAYGLLEYKQ